MYKPLPTYFLQVSSPFWEIWYKFQVTDNISVTPAFFTITNPAGTGSNSAYGGVLKTTFLF
jgi:carbohydrate-selective porin OprB